MPSWLVKLIIPVIKPDTLTFQVLRRNAKTFPKQLNGSGFAQVRELIVIFAFFWRKSY